MTRSIHKLNDLKIKSIDKPGRVSDGGGLYLRVSKAGTKSWSFVWKKDGNRFELGLGGYPALSLASARKIAAHHRELVAQGGNPLDEKKKAKGEPTFAECVEAYLAKGPGSNLSNEKHRKQWAMTLGPAYCAKIQNKKPSRITQSDIISILRPVWDTKTETASRLRGRIEKVLNTARPIDGWIGGINPAAWTGNLENHFTSRKALRKIRPVRHHPAMPYDDVPAFVSELRNKEGLSARALEFKIFTLCRTGEVLKAQWREVDFIQRLWTVPGERTKMRKQHVVPLTDPAFDLLKALHNVRQDEWVFPGSKRGKPLSDMALEMQMRRMGLRHYTPHGFRSSFRDWAGDETDFARETAEGCLAHKVGDATENAYRRRTAVKKRLNLLTAWANFCTGISADVVQLASNTG